MKNIISKITGFQRILTTASINSFASGLISIFISIYLLDLGYTFNQVIYYLMTHHLLLLFGVFFAIFISNRIGLIKLFVIRLLFLVGYLLLLFLLPDNPQLFFIIAICSGLESAFYWTPLNILMVRNTENKKMGTAWSRFIVVPKILSFFSPLIAAAIISQFGFHWLFFVTLIFYIISILPLLSLPSEKTSFNFSWKKIKETFFTYKRFFIPEIIDNLAEDGMVLWALFIYLTLTNVFYVAGVLMLVSIASLLFVLFLGKMTDRGNIHSMVKIGALLLVITWVFNYVIGILIVEPWVFYLGTVLVTLALKVFMVPYGSLMYNRARKDDVHFLVLREIPTVLGRQILFILALIFSAQLPMVFLLIGLMFIYFIFLNTKKLE